MPATTFFGGLDIGQASDPSALACVERTMQGDESYYTLRHLERFPLGTPYPTLVEMVASRYKHPALSWSKLGMDYTGVGRPVVDMCRFGGVTAHIVPITITAGSKVTSDPMSKGYGVPKHDLVNTLQVVLSGGRIRWPSSGREFDALKKELVDFRVKISKAANEQFGAWGSGQHDDMVIALTLALWLGEQTAGAGVSGISMPAVGKRNVVERAPKGVFQS